MLTFGQLKEAERLILYPSPGEPRNLRVAHDRAFVEGMIDLQQWVPCLQHNNTSVHAACSTYVQCAKTVVPAPYGAIKRVYTIANNEFCDRVFYQSVNFHHLEAWARNLMLFWTNPANTSNLPQGFRDPDKTNDWKCGRALTGMWAIDRKRLYVTPWLESNESLVIEWDGVQTDWRDDDVLDEDYWTTEARSAVRAYVKWRHEREFGCDETRIARLERDYRDQLADLIHWCEHYTEVKPIVESGVVPRLPSQEELDASKVPEEADETIVAANIGDFGKPTESAGAGVQGVADLVESWNPAFVFTNGDNIYAPTTTYAAAVGAYYGDFITADLNTTRFYPVAGNHDHSDPTNGFADYLAYFTLPGNERYYEFVKSAVHFFMLHSAIGVVGSASPETDGVSVTSTQAMWLKAKLATSPAKWKVVVVHDSPYTLGPDYPGHTVLRWPFKTWGASVLLSGDCHRYERYEIDGFPYLINGLGGATRDTSPNADAGNLLTPYKKASYHADWGAIKMTANCDELKFEFITRTGVLIDTLILT